MSGIRGEKGQQELRAAQRGLQQPPLLTPFLCPPPWVPATLFSSCVNKLPLRAYFMGWRPQRAFPPSSQNVSTRKPIKPLPSCSARKDHSFHTIQNLLPEVFRLISVCFPGAGLLFPSSVPSPHPTLVSAPSHLKRSDVPPDRCFLLSGCISTTEVLITAHPWSLPRILHQNPMGWGCY